MIPEDFRDQLIEKIRQVVREEGGILGPNLVNSGVFTIPGMRGEWEYKVSAHNRGRNGQPVVKAFIMHHRTKTITMYLRKSQHMQRNPSGVTWNHTRIAKYLAFEDANLDPFFTALRTVMGTGCGLVYDLKRRNKAPGCKRCPVELFCLMREGDFA